MITSPLSVTISINAGADAIHNWASFGDYTVMAKPSLVASKSAYNQVCANADAAISAFPVDACAEISAVNTAKTVSEETIVAYDNATAAVTAAVETLTAAKATYQALVNAKVANSKKYNYMDYPEVEGAIKELSEKFKDEGRVLIRPSGTEPLVRVMIEGKNQEQIDKEARMLAALIEKVMA